MEIDIFEVEVVEHNEELLNNDFIQEGLAIGIGSYTLYSTESTFNVLILTLDNLEIVKEYIFTSKGEYLNVSKLNILWHTKIVPMFVDKLKDKYASKYFFDTLELHNILYENREQNDLTD